MVMAESNEFPVNIAPHLARLGAACRAAFMNQAICVSGKDGKHERRCCTQTMLDDK